MNEQIPQAGLSGTDPMVSVITTTYNGAAYLRETIDSIIHQTLGDFEYIIIDDRSSDDTVSIIKSYHDPRIIFVQNERNIGISESRNAGFRLARGEYIATTDQDDVSEPNRLDRQVKYLQANPDISVAASKVAILFHGSLQGDPMPVQDHPLLIHFALYFGRHNTTYSSLLLRRKFVIDNDLFFRPWFRYAEDFELFSRIVECGRFAILPEPLVSYRKHQSNNSSVHYDEMAANGQTFMKQCYERQLGRPINPSESKSVWFGLVEKTPPGTSTELRALGRLMSELTAKFIARHASDAVLAKRVRRLAANIWNDIVDGAVRAVGLRAELIRTEFPELRAWSPSLPVRARTVVKGAAKRLLATIGRGRSAKV